MLSYSTLNQAWLCVLRTLFSSGQKISPRGQVTLEVPQLTIAVPLDASVLSLPERKLSYKFMAAEARWIINGDDRVATIAPYNSRIAHYSDDGQTFFGAYGPRYRDQLPHVVQKLVDDPDSRQAGLTLWRPNPPMTKDVPCTVALFFQIRNGQLNVHAFMRSSDAWLGLPYDAFNFAMLGYHVRGFVNQRWLGYAAGRGDPGPVLVAPGTLYLTMASSHLYEEHWDRAHAIAYAYDLDDPRLTDYERANPGELGNETDLLAALELIADAGMGRWWENKV